MAINSQFDTHGASGFVPDEIELLRTHSLKKIQRMYLADQILNVIGWLAFVGIIAAGCYWLVQL